MLILRGMVTAQSPAKTPLLGWNKAVLKLNCVVIGTLGENGLGRIKKGVKTY